MKTSLAILSMLLIATSLLKFSGQASWSVSTYLVVATGITLFSISLATETCQSDFAAAAGDQTTTKGQF